MFYLRIAERKVKSESEWVGVEEEVSYSREGVT